MYKEQGTTFFRKREGEEKNESQIQRRGGGGGGEGGPLMCVMEMAVGRGRDRGKSGCIILLFPSLLSLISFPPSPLMYADTMGFCEREEEEKVLFQPPLPPALPEAVMKLDLVVGGKRRDMKKEVFSAYSSGQNSWTQRNCH